MQICTHCKAQQLDGAIFCSECGASLLSSLRSRETTAALNKAADDMPTVEESELAVEAATPTATAARTVCLVVLNSGRRIAVEAEEELLIGRKDNQRGIFPDIDLGLDGGYDAGVSRRHALIIPGMAGFSVTDLSSANGTFINGQRLAPETPSPIGHGDELKLGTLIMRFEVG